MRSDILLVSIPWAPVRSPSIQTGLLKSALLAHGLYAHNLYLNVDLYRFMQERPGLGKSANEFDELWTSSAAIRWVFASAPVFDDAEVARIVDLRRPAGDDAEAHEAHDFAVRLRAEMPAFYEQCARAVLEHDPKVVGFSCTLGERIFALALAKILKERRPDLKIVLGGTYMEGMLGEATLRTFPWVDVVVRGEAEELVGPLFRELCEGRPVTMQPGLCVRRGDTVEIDAEPFASVNDLAVLPVPSYDEYFTAIEGTELEEKAELPVETSRGCWWFRYKCKFCGRSEDVLRYRTKKVEQVANELRTLASRHQAVDFTMPDPCVEARFMVRLMAGLKAEGYDFKTWCQTKTNIAKDRVQAMGWGGVEMYAGIESLSTPILDLMRKGTTALEAIRLLKWGAEFNMPVYWNLIYNTPGEKEEHYRSVTRTIPSLTHLRPPLSLVPLSLSRDSVYFDQPEEYQIELIAPKVDDHPVYLLAQELDPEVRLMDLADAVDCRYVRLPDEVIDAWKQAVWDWKKHAEASYRQLTYRVGLGAVKVYDYRSNSESRVYTLEGPSGKLYLACDAGATIEQALQALSPSEREGLTRDDVKELFDDLIESRLMYKDGVLYLSLAIAQRVDPRPLVAIQPPAEPANGHKKRRSLALVAPSSISKPDNEHPMSQGAQ